MEKSPLNFWGKVSQYLTLYKMSNWGNFSEQSYSDFLKAVANPTNYMVVAPALASRAAAAPQSFFMDEDEDEDEDEESNARMAMGQLRSMAEDIMLILSQLTPDDDLEPWVAAKITMSKQNLSAVADYLRFSDDYSEEDEFDFTRCQRPDGSFYGTRGKCKKGTDAGAKPAPPPKAPRAPKAPKAPRGAKGPKKSMTGPEGYLKATDAERAAALDKEVAREAKRPKTAQDAERARRQAEVNARAAQMAAEERRKKMTGPEGYMRATDEERARALDREDRQQRTNRVMQGLPEREPPSAQQRATNARAAAMDREARASRLRGPEGYNRASDQQRADALGAEEQRSRAQPRTAQDEARARQQAEANRRATEAGFGAAGALRQKYGPKS